MRYTIKTSGLMCGHCDATVETALPRLSRWSAPTP